MKKNLWFWLTLLVVMTLVAACGGAATPAPEQPAAEKPAAATEEPAAQAPAATEEAAPAATEEAAAAGGAMGAEGGFLAQAMNGDFKGTKVSMMGPFTEEDAVKFNNAIKDFEDKTGIDIQYEGTKEFEATISVRVDAGDPPDIVDFPQPGLLANFAKEGKVVDVGSFISQDWLKQQYNQSWLDMATMQGQDGPITAGVWHRFNGKSLVWYPKEQFDKAGYEIPQTWDELIELSDTIVADGDTPWCIGIESGAATGWPATDWIEDIMLRTTSLENYDKWVIGELKFESPEVKNAAETMAKIWLDDQYVNGGRKGIVSTFFGDAPTPMFDDPPKCWLHRQGNFITSFFPAGKEAGKDYDFFYLPPIDEAQGKPFLVAGDIMAVFNDRPEVRAVEEYFTTGESVKGWLAAGGALSPHLDTQLDWYGNDVERGIAEIVAQSTAFRFDASDLMPGEVGAGSFWKGMTDWISGSIDLDTALQEIDASWPQKK